MILQQVQYLDNRYFFLSKLDLSVCSGDIVDFLSIGRNWPQET